MSTRSLIVVAVIALVFVISLTVFLGSLTGRQTSQNDQLTPIPTQSFPSRSFPQTISQSLTPLEQQRRIAESRSLFSSLSTEETDVLNDFKTKLPYTSAEFDISYSEGLDEFFIQEKTQDAETKLAGFLQANNVFSIYQSRPSLFRKSSRTQLLNEEEERFKNNEIRLNDSEHIPPVEEGPSIDTSTPSTSGETQVLIDVLKNVISHLNTPDASPSAVQPSPSTAVTSLAQIFNEAGQKVGVPPRILEAVMKIECGRLFQLPAEKIIEYSQPGNGLPANHYCFKNFAGAHGPMQFLQSTWRAYASAANKYGGYTHTPYIENIRDSVYAAASKLKSDSRSPAPDNWSEAQVKRAAMCYNDSCRRSAYLKGLKQYYHEFVWNFYQGRI